MDVRGQKNRGKRLLDVAAANNFERLNTNVNFVLPFSGFYIHDSFSNRLFLVDTGAFISVFDVDCANCQLAGLQFVSANGLTISTYGSRDICLSFGGRTFSWPFIIADARKPLLRADILTHHSLLVDVYSHRLVDEHYCPLSIDVLEVEADMCTPYQPSKYDFLFKEFGGRFLT